MRFQRYSAIRYIRTAVSMQRLGPNFPTQQCINGASIVPEGAVAGQRHLEIPPA